jgi:hypothetical protein
VEWVATTSHPFAGPQGSEIFSRCPRLKKPEIKMPTKPSTMRILLRMEEVKV